MAAAVDSIFDEDEVCRKIEDDRYEFGLVVESSEYVSSDEDDDEEDRLKKGTVRVAWHPEGKETIEEEKKLILADRSLMPGDVVRRIIEGKSSPRGFVQDMKVLCHVNIKGTNKYIYNVDSKDISSGSYEDPFNKYFKNDHPDVTMDSWIGKIEEVYEAVTLLFPDGAMCKVVEAEDLHYEFDSINDRCKDEAPDSTFSSEGMFYKGKILRGKIGDLQGAEWFQPTKSYSSKVAKKNPRLMVTVRIEEVEVTSVKVHWLFRGFGNPENSSNSMEVPPAKVVPPKLSKLINLDWYSYCSVQVGDKSSYEIKPTDQLVDVPPKFNFVPDALSSENLEDATKNDLATKSKSSVDESASNDCASEAQSTLSRETSGELHVSENSNQAKQAKVTESESMEFDTVEEKEADEDYEDVESSEEEKNEEKTVSQTKKFSHAPRKKRKTKTSKKAERKTKAEAKFYPPFPTCQPGEKLTVEVCYTFSKADVMWQNGDIERDIPSTDLVPIHHLDELEFFPGDFVVPEKDGTTEKYGVVVNCDHIERTCLVRWMKVVDLAKGERPDKDYEEEEVSVYDIKDHPDFKFRPSQAVIRVGEPLDANECKFTAGQISKLDPTGTLIVKWPDGKESRCYPQELYIALEELDESDSSWSTVCSDSDDSDSTDSMDSWETENEEEVESDAEEERKSDKEKPLIISREKKDELLDFLAVTEDSLRTLKNVFKNEDSLRTLKEFLKEEDGQPPVYTSYGNLKGIMHLYRKCQDMEKFLKSSYFEGQKLKDLIEELKEYLKEEKRNERNDRILSIHKTRQSSSSVSNKENQEQSDVSGNEKSVVVNGDLVVEEDDSGVSVTCSGEKSSLSSSNEPEQKSVLSNSLCTESNVPSNISNGESAEKVSSTENNLSSSCTNGELEDRKSSGAKSQSDLPNPGQKLAKKAKLCHEIVSELLSRMKLFKDAIKRRWSLTMKETENALAKFSKGDSKSSSADDAAPEGGKGAMNDKTPEGDKAAMNGLDKKAESSEEEETKFKKQIEEMDPDDIKNMLMSIVQSEDRRGCEILEEVLLGIDTDKSKVKNAWNEMSTNVINFKDIITSDIEGLHLMEEVPLAHKFCSKEYSPGNPKSFTTALSKELKLLQSSLPNGIIVKAFEDRMDLFSVMIVGPPGTPYEDALFFFDVQVPGDYPSSPPEFHYISYCKDRLNPNLYEDGKVCVSLLGTWSGKGNETWTDKSNLLQALVSIQGLILVAEPYYNEAGYEKQRGSQQGLENSKMYNEMAILKVVQSTARMISNPPHSFLQEMTSHLRVRGPRMVERLEAWINLSSEPTLSSSKPELKVDNYESAQAMSGKTSGILSVAYSKSVDNIEHSEEVLARSKDSFTDSNTDSNIKSEETSVMQTNSSDKACMNNPQHSEEILACSKDPSIECKIKSEETSMPSEEMQTNSSDKACADNSHDEKCLSSINMPEFPLLPASKGFCITMKKNLQSLRNSLEQLSN